MNHHMPNQFLLVIEQALEPGPGNDGMVPNNDGYE